MVVDVKNMAWLVYGVPNFEKTKIFERVPAQVREKLPSLSFLGRRTPGGRVLFRTASPWFKIIIELETLSPDIGMSIYSSQSAFVYLGARQSSRLLGIVNPPNYETKKFEKTFQKGEGVDEITVFLPRNEIVKDVYIEIEDGYTVDAPTPHKYSVPVLFYGSSITECALASNPCAAYVNLCARHLDFDYINFGFSGNCRAEDEMADYINTLDFSVFIYDYDHNAPTAEYLSITHEVFFKKIRSAHPNVPIIMVSRPTANFGYDEIRRRDIVKKTYENALDAGDKNVYFVDGEDFFRYFPDKEVCFTDTIHPTDLGFYKMAQVIEPVIERALTK